MDESWVTKWFGRIIEAILSFFFQREIIWENRPKIYVDRRRTVSWTKPFLIMIIAILTMVLIFQVASLPPALP